MCPDWEAAGDPLVRWLALSLLSHTSQGLACILKEMPKLVNFCVAILILKKEENMQHFWHIMLYYFKKGKNITEMQKKICAVYGRDAVTD